MLGFFVRHSGGALLKNARRLHKKRNEKRSRGDFVTFSGNRKWRQRTPIHHSAACRIDGAAGSGGLALRLAV
jgi:hypothetical protein